MRKFISMMMVAFVALFAISCDKPSQEEPTSGVTFQFQNAKSSLARGRRCGWGQQGCLSLTPALEPARLAPGPCPL